MSVLGNIFGAVKDNVVAGAQVAAINVLDNKTKLQAGLREKEDNLNTAKEVAGRAEATAQGLEATYAKVKSELDEYKSAYDILKSQDKATPERKEILIKHLDAAESAKKQAEDARAYATEKVATLQSVADDLTKFKSAYEESQRNLERAESEAREATQREEDAKKLAGLSHGIDTDNIILGSMQAQTDKLRQQTATAKLSADALSHAVDSSGDDADMKAALAQVRGKSSSSVSDDDLEARLSKL